MQYAKKKTHTQKKKHKKAAKKTVHTNEMVCGMHKILLLGNQKKRGIPLNFPPSPQNIFFEKSSTKFRNCVQLCVKFRRGAGFLEEKKILEKLQQTAKMQTAKLKGMVHNSPPFLRFRGINGIIPTTNHFCVLGTVLPIQRGKKWKKQPEYILYVTNY